MSRADLPDGVISASPSGSRPTRRSGAVFAAKAMALRTRRAASDLMAGPTRLGRAGGPARAMVIARSRTPLWADEGLAERAAQLGKVQNLRVACRALDGLVLPAGATFSFWRQVGPPTRGRGYARGRMLREGCMVLSVGGGLCQLSNALYDVATRAGCGITERHAHSRIVPGSLAAAGRDATVAWNYVDLRFVADRPLRLSARLDRDGLVVELLGAPHDADAPLAPWACGEARPTARSCATCGETRCHRNERSPAAGAAPGHRAFLVDEAWPEFRAYLAAEAAPGDQVAVPLDGARLGLARYAWPTAGRGGRVSAPLATLSRAWAQRAAGAHGPRRRAAEIAGAHHIANALARRLTPEVTALTVAQSYLPHLWREGHLGGREVSVLMTRLPMTVLQDRLDAAARAHPERRTLADFRAPQALLEAEAAALAEARWIVTPHEEIAGLFGERALRLDWQAAPAAVARRESGPVRRIVFPGPTIARKGAHLVREVALALGLEVMALGSVLEGEGFWRGVRLLEPGDWRALDVMVHPALVEDQPRRLLAALAAGVPVVATAACGLGPRPGLTLIPPDDPAALIAALAALGSNVADRPCGG